LRALTAIESVDSSATRLSIERIRPAYEQVADRLRTLISDGEMKPGERLPNEGDLAGMFGVSRSTVREAIRVLSSQRLLVTVRGVAGGTFVTRPDAAHISDVLLSGLSVLVTTQTVPIAELLESRTVLEVPAARLAAARRTDADVATLDALARKPHHDAGGFPDHRDFHMAVLDASGNGLLSALARPLFLVLEEAIVRLDLTTELMARTDDDHVAIFEAIRDGDADGAGQTMERHLADLHVAWDGWLAASARRKKRKKAR
jgi:DNA-binding FadR family transcriptional regulator